MLSPSTPLTSGAQEIIRPSPKSSEELRPFTKAGPRKPKGRCRILTATSEKFAVETEVAAILKKNIKTYKTVLKFQKAKKYLFGLINKKTMLKTTDGKTKKPK